MEKKLSSALLRLYAHASLTEFPLKIVDSLHLLFPEGTIAIDEVFTKSGEVTHHYHDEVLAKPEVWEAWRLYSHEHPGVRHVADGARVPVLHLSDLISQSKLHKLDLYQTVLAPVNAQDQISFNLRGAAASILGVTIGLPKKVTDSERNLAGLMVHHLAQAQRNASLVSGNDSGSFLEREFRYEIEIPRGDSVRIRESEAQKLIELFFGGRKSIPWRPPEELLLWIESRRRYLSRPGTSWRRLEPLILMNERGTLHVNFSRTSDSQSEILFLNAKLKSSFVRGHPRQLTLREQQVVNWIVEGKSNSEIATILSITTATVKKHVENVFSKLGVENRSALIVRVLKSKTAHDFGVI
ncbi:MAG TPA: helix-turn-helix transcriptional regulator [Candidatus Methylacidiphilales bacterium]